MTTQTQNQIQSQSQSQSQPAAQTVPFVIDAEGTGVAQTITVAGENAHVIQADTYPSFGGQDAAPSPLAYALAALSSCNQVTGSIVAAGLGVRLGRWSVHVQGDLNPAVIGGGAQGNANFDRVTSRVSVQTDATQEQFDTLVAETERRCPVTQLFQRSGTEFSSQWSRVPLDD